MTRSAHLSAELSRPSSLPFSTMSSSPAPRRPRETAPVVPLAQIPALDGVRGIAILAVMAHNLSGIGPVEPTAVGRAFEWGWTGVQLFFVLSGYLITRILLDAGRTSGVLGAFLARRALRIVPLYYATLLVYFFVVPRLFDAPTVTAALPHQLWYWLFVSNWGEPLGFGAPGLQHLWSIGVEMQFYVVWPILAIGASERRVRRTCLAILALSLACRVGLVLGFGASASAVYKFSITRMSAPAIGALVALVARRRAWGNLYARHRRALGWGSAGALVLLALARHGFNHTDPAVQVFGYTLIALIFAQWVLAIVLRLPAPAGLTTTLPGWAPLRAIGHLSYGMYVLHYPLHWAAMKVVGPWLLAGPWSTARQLGYIAAMIVGTTVLAWLSWNLFEKRFLSLKRFFPVTRTVPADVLPGAEAPSGGPDTARFRTVSAP
jgi:peptidoglycan/LPS O-acetylase OafA/YrhL